MTRLPPRARRAPRGAARPGRPTVAIGMPVYNEAEFLPRAVDALLAQTFDDFELVLVDDHSSDASPGLCRAYARRDPRIRFHRNEANRGAVYTFNRARDLAAGRYFLWATAHDVRLPRYLARCVEYLDRHEDVALCHTTSRMIDADDRPVAPPLPGIEAMAASPYARARDLLWTMARSPTLDAFDGVYRTRDLQEVRPGVNGWGTDNVFLLDVALRGKLAVLPEPLFLRRLNRGPSASIERHVEDLFARLDPANRSRRWKPAYAALLARYLATIQRAPVGALEKVRLQAHAVASLVRHRLPELVVHDFLLEPLRVVLGRRFVSPLSVPFEWVARRTKFAAHPQLAPAGRVISPTAHARP